jgi:hypothetical protein
MRSGPGLQPAAAAAPQAAVVDKHAAAYDAAQSIESSLQQLQHSVANLDAEPCTDGLLTAYQQLRHIMQQLLQEQRRCQATIHRTKWKLTAGRRSGSGGSSSSSTNDSKRGSPGSPLPASSTSQQEDDEPQLQQQQQAPAGSSSTAAGLPSTESAQLMHLRQLRAKCDDAQDYLVGLIHAHLQVRGSAVAAHATQHPLMSPAYAGTLPCSHE